MDLIKLHKLRTGLQVHSFEEKSYYEEENSDLEYILQLKSFNGNNILLSDKSR